MPRCSPLFPALLVFGLLACNGGKAAIYEGEGGITPMPDGGRGDSGVNVDAGGDTGTLDGGPASDSGMDSGIPTDGGVDAGDDWGPRCEYDISPSAINYGQVRPGDFLDGGVLGLFTITDTLGSCLVSLTLTADTDPAFSLVGGPVVSEQLSAPGNDAGLPSQLTASVLFTATTPGGYGGAVTFGIDGPPSPSWRFPFSITIGTPCFLLRPATLDFGTVTRGPCPGAHPLTFEAINGCAEPVTLQSIDVSDAGSFVLVDGQVPQVVAQGETSSPFTVEFPGGEDGTYTGSMAVQTDLDPDPFIVSFAASVAPGTAQTDTFTFSGNYLFLLSGTPDRDGPSLSVNGTVLREGQDWSFDLLTDILAIDSTWRTLNDGDRVEISYHLACD